MPRGFGVISLSNSAVKNRQRAKSGGLGRKSKNDKIVKGSKGVLKSKTAAAASSVDSSELKHDSMDMEVLGSSSSSSSTSTTTTANRSTRRNALKQQLKQQQQLPGTGKARLGARGRDGAAPVLSGTAALRLSKKKMRRLQTQLKITQAELQSAGLEANELEAIKQATKSELAKVSADIDSMSMAFNAVKA
jgi:hypothetical protein